MTTLDTSTRMHPSPFAGALIELDPTDTWDQIVDKAGFDYEVIKSDTPQQTIAPDGSTVVYPGDFGMMALHNGVYHPIKDSGTVGRRYEPLPMPGDAFNALISEGLMIPDQAGRWGWHTQFVSFLLPEGFSIDGDPSARRITFVGPHDGTGAWRMKGHENRWFCQNQRPIIVGRSGSLIAFRHSRASRDAMRHIHSQITTMLKAFEEDAALMESLYAADVTMADVERFVERMVPDPKRLVDKPAMQYQRGDQRAVNAIMEKRRGIRETILLSPTMNNLREPMAGRMPAVTLLHGYVEWSDHHSPVRGQRDQQARRGRRILMGLDVAEKRRAQEATVALALR